jgi:hypothetical protein
MVLPGVLVLMTVACGGGSSPVSPSTTTPTITINETGVSPAVFLRGKYVA